MIRDVPLLTRPYFDVNAPSPRAVNMQYFRHFSVFKGAKGMWSSMSHNAVCWNDVYSNRQTERWRL